MTTSGVRVRIAPSPTGEPHVGTAYIALFNYLFAKKHGGEFILRIEDTDATRSTPEFETKVLDALKWCGLKWSEGPDIGGPYGPYRQSDRKDLYKPYVEKIVDAGHGFRCFCTPERLEQMRAAQRAAGLPPKYDGHCLNLSAEEVSSRVAAGEPHVVRMKIPTEGSCKFHDGVYGDVEIPWDAVDMQVLLKADGMPTYHMANVVDDHLMKITHVARGEEWLASVPKHILIYRYLGLEPPVFMHLSLMRNADKSKLSKRKNPTSISYYTALGYIPEALMNFLGLFFVQIAEGDELLTMDELAEKFDPENLSKAGAIFDIQKLDWLNGRWIREKLSEEEFQQRVLTWAMENSRLQEGLKLSQSRISKLGELPDLTGFLFKSDLNLDPSAFARIKSTPEELLEILNTVQPDLEKILEWNVETIEAELRAIADRMGKKLKVIVAPLFVAVSGSSRSLPLFDSMAILGRSVVRQRLKLAAQTVATLVGPKN
ncbi:glutamate--tRNA ligase [Rhizobium rhizogenes]|uniref:Glutamate--tRNA ligase n=1 Tax=Rhizobium rhizogenes (strain K84 / ATCC BAA-868) TaxID=311403 RepID=B9JAG5_RHIR8|nr:glutamate--tRNA ligase [Rhizobium rhizogenes]ACM27780.1 glutamyl-tRNA synthetase protein [Rhizobium rhizogenes K84]OCJ13830.1 glutamate--tRNA ligase [Agrobacterium sp. B131/95]KEA05653.1 glutamyl-tRNA synthetase [Rhizobium rhizogenes]MDJ1637770.1 glutamate--tRNA ligase [Rhizobium rhizogenes]MQB32234.1 glutamate--tRNA ligase [Rhizobium rhizogenes]